MYSFRARRNTEHSPIQQKVVVEIVFCLKIVEEESMNIVDIRQSDSNKCFMVAIKQKDY